MEKPILVDHFSRKHMFFFLIYVSLPQSKSIGKKCSESTSYILCRFSARSLEPLTLLFRFPPPSPFPPFTLPPQRAEKRHTLLFRQAEVLQNLTNLQQVSFRAAWPFLRYPLVIRRGNGNSSINESLNGRIIYKWWIFNCNV